MTTPTLTPEQKAALEAVMRAFAGKGGALVVTTEGYALNASDVPAMHMILANAAEQIASVHRQIVEREKKEKGPALVVARSLPGIPTMKAT